MEKATENPSYFAIIPANVRYDDDLKDKAKLLYGEITCLCNRYGYCWATNNYFANLYKVHKMTISRLLNDLEKKNYITIKIKKSKKREIESRQIFINNPISKNIDTYKQNCLYPISKNAYYNNTSNNNKKENKRSKRNYTSEQIENWYV